MASREVERDAYDLNYERPQVPIPYSRNENRRLVSTPETVAARETNLHRRHLNDISRDLRHQLEKKDVYACSIYFLLRSLDPTLNRAPAVDHAPSFGLRSRPPQG
ncbi:hypothetical protein VMCG_10399 [Cytospora schulzeri]|uniref:Uncharacterized protein n=1 Tax=Cytospora schulzeri TaxID=448051 RepID=A0A423VB08_9PEZI|nr:hypothetical protein VMCG_10399 [Valsa malicola]